MLAILDVVTPRMEGALAATQLRSRFPNLPVLTSGYSATTGAANSLISNSYYLQKPYSPRSFGRLIRKMLDMVETAGNGDPLGDA